MQGSLGLRGATLGSFQDGSYGFVFGSPAFGGLGLGLRVYGLGSTAATSTTTTTTILLLAAAAYYGLSYTVNPIKLEPD